MQPVPNEFAQKRGATPFQNEWKTLSTPGFPFMFVGYVRVSSETDRQNFDLQRDALIAVGVDSRHLFEDRDSGARTDRPGLTQALAFVRPGDVLVAWKLDRLGRSLTHLIEIVNTLKANQVAFRSLTEGMDTTTASGELFFHVFSALAQYERALIKERSRSRRMAAWLKSSPL